MTDFLRWILIFGCAVIDGWAFFILQEAGKFRPPPKNIRLEAFAYILSIAYVAIETHSHLGDPLTWRLPTGFFIIGFGLYAMFSMQRYYDYDERIRRHREKAERQAFKLVDTATRIAEAEQDVR